MFALTMSDDHISMRKRRDDIISGLRQLPGHIFSRASSKASKEHIDFLDELFLKYSFLSMRKNPSTDVRHLTSCHASLNGTVDK